MAFQQVYNVDHKKFIVRVQLAGASGRVTRNLFAEEFPDMPVPSLQTVQAYLNHFNEHGCVNDRHDGERRRRPNRVILDEDMRIRICAMVEMDPHLPSRQIAREVGVSQPSVLKVLKEAGYFPYKIRSGQILLTPDPERRLQMCNEFIRRFRADPTFKRRILWTDECTFFVDGKRNVQHMRTWSRENPFLQVPTHSQYQQKVNVWCGIIDEHIIGPFFIEGNLTSEKYQQLLIEDVGPALHHIFGDEETVYPQNYTLYGTTIL